MGSCCSDESGSAHRSDQAIQMQHRLKLQYLGTGSENKDKVKSLTRLYSEFLRSADTKSDGGPMVLSENNLRQLFGKSFSVNPVICHQLLAIMDRDGDGEVDVREFSSTMAMLLNAEDTLDDRVHLAFYMFDSNKSGALSKKQFQRLLNATLNTRLISLLHNPTGASYLRQHMQKEFSLENLDFWNATEALSGDSAPSDEEQFERECVRIYERYIDEDSEECVNISAATRAEIRKFIKLRETDRVPIPREVYHAAAGEVFQLIKADTFARFKANHEVIDKMVEQLWTQVHGKESSNVSFIEFYQFALKNPETVSFISDLRAMILGAIPEDRRSEHVNEEMKKQLHTVKRSLGGGEPILSSIRASAADRNRRTKGSSVSLDRLVISEVLPEPPARPRDSNLNPRASGLDSKATRQSQTPRRSPRSSHIQLAYVAEKDAGNSSASSKPPVVQEAPVEEAPEKNTAEQTAGRNSDGTAVARRSRVLEGTPGIVSMRSTSMSVSSQLGVDDSGGTSMPGSARASVENRRQGMRASLLQGIDDVAE